MSLRLLILDDNPDDRALALREIRREFEVVAATEVADREGFEAALEEPPFDIVVTDYQMRWTTGLEVLKRVKTRWPGLPVIMFTATGTQEIAVAAMKAGLDDYVIKSPRHYIRLPVAIRSCLDRNEIRLRAYRSETRLQGLLEHARMGVFRLSMHGELVDANRSMRRLLGLDDMAGLDDVDSPLLDAARGMADALHARGDSAEQEVIIGEGESRQYLALKTVRVPVNGHDAIDGLVDDLTSLRRADLSLHELNRDLERRVQERTRQLEEANESLETFAYSISHDIREPMRTLMGYAAACREDIAAGRMDELATFAARIDAIAARVDGMVGDLFAYSRLARDDITLGPVDLEQALADATGFLAHDPAFQQARLEVEGRPWPSVQGHASTLVLTLVNLLSNAAKFVAPGESADVHVAVRRLDGRARVEVRDRGIGIPEAEQARIFDVFQRLHGEESYPGTGIGLALVRKGVERMGGRIGVESAPGAGACFWFELDACEPG